MHSDIDSLYHSQQKSLQQRGTEEGSSKYPVPQIQANEEEASSAERGYEQQDKELLNKLSKITGKQEYNSVEDYFSLDAEFLQLTRYQYLRKYH